MESNFPQFNGFHIDREIGQSDDSTFYSGVEKQTRKKILVKLLKPIYNSESLIVQNFIEDAKFFAQLNDPAMIKVFDFGQEGGYFFTTYERPVVTLLDRIPQLTMSESIGLFEDTVKAIEILHLQGYVHGHLTPASILFREDGSLAIMNLGAFIFQSYQNTLFDNSSVSPATYYKSPEQCRNQPIDIRSDHYSLGAILFTLLTHKPPYQADNTVGIIGKHLEAPPPQLQQEYSRYQPLLDKMMAKDPVNRTQNSRDILEWLGAGEGFHTGNEHLELDFSPDSFSPENGSSPNRALNSPYTQNVSNKSRQWRLFIPAILFLSLAIYFLFFRPDSGPKDLSKSQFEVSKNSKITKTENITNMTDEEIGFLEIESAIDRGELSLAESKLNSILEKKGESKESLRLRDLLIKKETEGKKQQYVAQIAIAEAALNDNDLTLAEQALSQARILMIDSDLIRLEQLLQNKIAAPQVEDQNSIPLELQVDSAEDDRTFQRAKMTRSKKMVSEYLKLFPNGKHKQEAIALFQEISNPNNTQVKKTTSDNPPKNNSIMYFTLSDRPSQISPATVYEILQTTDFFESKINPNGKFDNPLELIEKNNATTYVDPGLKRMWLVNIYASSLTFTQAQQWILTLNEQQVAGYTDWRLPTLAEIMSLLRPQKVKNLLFNQQFFKQPQALWSSDHFDKDNVWVVFYTKGIVDNYRKTDLLSSMAIRTHSKD